MFIWTLADGSGITHDHSEGWCPFEPGGSMAGRAEQVHQAMVADGAVCPDCGQPAHSAPPRRRTPMDMSPSERVAFIDHALTHAPTPPGFDLLSPATLARLEQMKHALCDDQLDEDTYCRLEEDFRDYLDSLPDEEEHQAHLACVAFAAGVEALMEVDEQMNP